MEIFETWRKQVKCQKTKVIFLVEQTLRQGTALREQNFLDWNFKPTGSAKFGRLMLLTWINCKRQKWCKIFTSCNRFLSRFLRVEPIKTETAAETTDVFKRMTTKIFPEKVWSDKETEFKGELKQLWFQNCRALQHTQCNKVCFCLAKYSISENFDL